MGLATMVPRPAPSRRGFLKTVAAASLAAGAPVPNTQNAAVLRGLFHHAIVIVKENHTYDDFFGDIVDGNGDPGLCTFCDVTPNHHALAKAFGLFDNFFVDSIVSADGHNWLTQAFATDYVEKSMSGFARSYPSAGNDVLAYSGEGFIWNRFLDAGL